MQTEIKFGSRFRKRYRLADRKIKTAFDHSLEVFLEDANHPSLRDHPLHDKYYGYRSIDVTEDWRAIYKVNQSSKRKVVTFHMLGTHKELYG